MKHNFCSYQGSFVGNVSLNYGTKWIIWEGVLARFSVTAKRIGTQWEYVGGDFSGSL